VKIAKNISNLFEQYGSVVLSVGIRGASVITSAAVTWFISRYYGASANGQFALVNQTAIFLSVVGLFGLDLAAVRHFSAVSSAHGRLSRVTFLQMAAFSFTFLAGISAVVLVARSAIMAGIFNGVIPIEFLIISVFLILGRGGARLFGAVLRSQGHFALGQALEALFTPLTVCISILLVKSLSLFNVLIINAGASILAMTIAFSICLTRTSVSGDIQPSMKTLFHSALPLWGVGIIANISEWYGLTVTAHLLGTAEVGYYRVATQITMAMQVISLSLFNVYTPKISTAFRESNMEQVGYLTRTATLLSAILALPIAFCILGFSDFILNLFGKEFLVAASVLKILVVGQLFFTLTGPCGMTMAMAGYEKTNLAFSVASILLIVFLVPLATWLWGLIGLAFCVSAVMISKNVASLVWLRLKLGLNVVTGSVAKVRG